MNSNSFSDIPIVSELCRITDNMYRMGWDERNGGNISILIDEDDIMPYVREKAERTIELSFDASPLSGRLLLITATGHYFRNVSLTPENSLGVLRFLPDGRHAEIIWGFEGDGRPTSELSSHVMTHIVRLKQDGDHRVVMHAHPTNLVAMTFVHNLSEKDFTRTLWKRHTECIMVFPDGIGVLPWMLFGSDTIGLATAEKMKQFRLVVWAYHGIFGTGNSLDEAFGLLECAEKAADIYMKTSAFAVINEMTDEQLKSIAAHLGVKPHQGWL